MFGPTSRDFSRAWNRFSVEGVPIFVDPLGWPGRGDGKFDAGPATFICRSLRPLLQTGSKAGLLLIVADLQS